ncbi:unnamed protein product, partial [marine sediment metagenome]
MGKIKRAFLFIAFGVSLAVSHYGLSYIYMFWLISAWLILVLAENLKMQKWKNSFYSKFSRYKGEKLARNPTSSSAGRRTIGSTFVILFVVFALVWYMYISGSTVFDSYVRIGEHLARNIFTEFLNPAASGFTVLLTPWKPGLLHTVNAIINYLNQIFIVIGVLVLLLRHRELKFEKEYAAFSVLSLVIVFAGILVPFLITFAAMQRLYYITLIFLAPFGVIGGITVFRMIGRVVKAPWKNERVR